MGLILFVIFLLVGVFLNDYIQSNHGSDIFRVIFIVLFYSLNCFLIASELNTNFDKKNKKEIIILFEVLWVLLSLGFLATIKISIDFILMISYFLILVYTIAKYFILKKDNEKPLRIMISDCNKWVYITTLTLLLVLSVYQLYKGIKPICICRYSAVAYFKEYENDLYYDYPFAQNDAYTGKPQIVKRADFPVFTYEVKGKLLDDKTVSPMYFKIFKPGSERKTIIIYKKGGYNGNYLYILSYVILNILSGIINFVLVIMFSVLYKMYKVTKKEDVKLEKI